MKILLILLCLITGCASAPIPPPVETFTREDMETLRQAIMTYDARQYAEMIKEHDLRYDYVHSITCPKGY